MIDGGPGVDILTGGWGADTFMMNDFNGDTITDFGAGDRLLFQGLQTSMSFSNGVLGIGTASLNLTGLNNVSLAVTRFFDGSAAIAIGGPPLIAATSALAASSAADPFGLG